MPRRKPFSPHHSNSSAFLPRTTPVWDKKTPRIQNLSNRDGTTVQTTMVPHKPTSKTTSKPVVVNKKNGSIKKSTSKKSQKIMVPAKPPLATIHEEEVRMDDDMDLADDDDDELSSLASFMNPVQQMWNSHAFMGRTIATTASVDETSVLTGCTSVGSSPEDDATAKEKPADVQSSTPSEPSPTTTTASSHHHHKTPSASNHDSPQASESASWWTAPTRPQSFVLQGRRYQHAPLPPGWQIAVSQTHQRPFYFHPDFGTTFYCPVVLPDDDERGGGGGVLEENELSPHTRTSVTLATRGIASPPVAFETPVPAVAASSYKASISSYKASTPTYETPSVASRGVPASATATVTSITPEEDVVDHVVLQSALPPTPRVAVETPLVSGVLKSHDATDFSMDHAPATDFPMDDGDGMLEDGPTDDAPAEATDFPMDDDDDDGMLEDGDGMLEDGDGMLEDGPGRNILEERCTATHRRASRFHPRVLRTDDVSVLTGTASWASYQSVRLTHPPVPFCALQNLSILPLYKKRRRVSMLQESP